MQRALKLCGLCAAFHSACCCRYVFLVDAQGRLRWRGSGSPSDSEMTTLLRCTEELLQQEGAGQQQQQSGGQAAAAAGA